MTSFLVTGSTSEIGKYLTTSLISKGFRTITAGRTGCDSYFDMTRPQDVPSLQNIQYLIHAAWRRTSNPREDLEMNLGGSRALLSEAVRQAAIPILISSDSAENAASLYGRAKRDLEDDFVRAGGYALRCGLVWGGGATPIITAIRRLSQIPLVCVHLHPEPLLRSTSLTDLVEVIEQISRSSPDARVIRVGSAQQFSLSSLSHQFRGSHVSIHVLLSTKLLYRLSVLCDTFGIHLPFNPDSLRSTFSDSRPPGGRLEHSVHGKDSSHEEFFAWVRKTSSF